MRTNIICKGIIFLFCVLFAFACNKFGDYDYFDRDAVITDIYVNMNAVTLDIGGTRQLTYWPIPANADPMKLMWTTNNPEVAVVSEWGIISAVGMGSTVITISDGNISKTINVTVQLPGTNNR